MWYCKLYFTGQHEAVESDAFGTQGVPAYRNYYPFLESLLSFTELNFEDTAAALRAVYDDLSCRERITDGMVKLGQLASAHVFFRALYTK